MLSKTLTALLLTIACVLPTTSSSSELTAENWRRVWVDFYIGQHGYPEDSGEALEVRLEKFAHDNGLSDSGLTAVYLFMREKNNLQRQIVSDESEIEEIRTGIADEFRDPESVKIRNVFRINQDVCGELNAKNAYGAYVGYEFFLAEDKKMDDASTENPGISPVNPRYTLLHIDDDGGTLALARCILSYSDNEGN